MTTKLRNLRASVLALCLKVDGSSRHCAKRNHEFPCAVPSNGTVEVDATEAKGREEGGEERGGNQRRSLTLPARYVAATNHLKPSFTVKVCMYVLTWNV